MRLICIGLVVFLLVGAGVCAARVSPEQAAAAAKYQRLAIVCVPGTGADPKYAPMLLKETEKMVPSRLGFLQKVDCLYEVPVDLSTIPPTVQLKNKGDYDGVLVLVYSTVGNMVLLDMTLVDTNTGAKVWSHQFATKDSDVQGRLMRHGYWVPTTVKQHFYGK
jgi:hypothetical protein